MPSLNSDTPAITFFHTRFCPHCLRARQLMAKLFRKHPEYKSITIQEIDENKEAAYAKQFDYYYVPAFYVGNKKVMEGAPTYEQIKSVFEAAAKVSHS